ncbi:hypothetical protein Y032_0015g2862 [Ancylostoma ceylanicum]|uniref:Uncharacterized protein n=1 Tax=Ancylostoma ceylanicum TaxID=53326 RepID=A0A016V982_9BILA|nr:hypothetical protein Y032_0015g2862 [Ancylostoma ceylanicum]
MKCLLLLVVFASYPLSTDSGKTAPDCKTYDEEMSPLLRQKIYDIVIKKLGPSLEQRKKGELPRKNLAFSMRRQKLLPRWTTCSTGPARVLGTQNRVCRERVNNETLSGPSAACRRASWASTHKFPSIFHTPVLFSVCYPTPHKVPLMGSYSQCLSTSPIFLNLRTVSLPPSIANFANTILQHQLVIHLPFSTFIRLFLGVLCSLVTVFVVITR